MPSRRKYIPEADGKQRPLGIAALEDKIVQAAVVAILTPIYEAEFLGFSYGFRPGRGQHDAMDALAYGINARKINWILDPEVHDVPSGVENASFEAVRPATPRCPRPVPSGMRLEFGLANSPGT